jgi:uncharacterized damage-inducible protein DinB
MASDLATFARETGGRHSNWGHPGLARLLAGVPAEEAASKPGPDLHSIWEEVNHIVHWSEDVLERLEGRGTRRPQAWPPGEGGETEWKQALARAARLHNAIVRRVGAMSPAALAARAPRSRRSHAQLILGWVAHVSYHAGRIALLRRLYQHARRPAPPAV